MLRAYKERQLVNGQRVKVYYNLHTGQFSVMDYKTGLVVAHGDGFMLAGPEFKVSQAGREKVIKEKKKNVHAFITGIYIQGSHDISDFESKRLDRILYNPYENREFISEKTDNHASRMEYMYVLFANKKAYGLGGIEQ